MGARKPISATTLALGIISLVVSLILLGILGYYAASLHGVTSVAAPFVAYVFIDIFVLLTAAALTISAAVREAKGVAVAGMVFQILGTIIGFVLMFNGFIGGTGVTVAEEEYEGKQSVPWKELEAVLYVIGICGLILVVSLIWASAMMCRLVHCCQCCGESQPRVVVVQQGGLPAYEIGQYMDRDQSQFDAPGKLDY